MEITSETLRAQYPLAFSAWGLLFPALIAVVALLVRILIAAQVARWDGPWKAAWETAHGRSLEHFRRRLIGLRQLMRLFRWVLGYGFLGVALVLDIDYVRAALANGTLGRDLLFWPLLILTSMALVTYVLFLVGERMTSVRILKLEQLTRVPHDPT